ncbi:MAG: LPS export ABC transporter ATP-binding protein [Gammaproteobacteria bacterium]|nr:LPS export ABC transporter ATP-binding protein [Gammaproteobacteria bacterium]
MTTLKAKNLVKNYRGISAVKDISLEVSSGEVVGLLGPNGAGKTTCFYMIVGSIRHDKGEIFLDKMEITRLAVHERGRAGIGYLPQEASIFRKLSARDNILSILERRPDLNKREREEKAVELINDFKIGKIQENMGSHLSGGERRRVEIARALATNPKFILLDEPFAGVDPISVDDIKEIITTLSRRNIGVLITDHNVREALDICHKAYIVNEGQIIAEGDSEVILNNKRVRQVYLGSNFRM